VRTSAVIHALLTRRCHRLPAKKAKVLTTFRELGVLPETCEALEAVGIIDAFAIQEMTLPVALAGQDVIGQAKTGTGKTLGFGIPLLQRLIAPTDADVEFLAAPGKPQALVVVPTRELCVQVAKDLRVAGSHRKVRVLEIYGGRAYEPQIETLRQGVDVIVGTPGRLIDLANQRHVDLSHVKVLVLDEADEMLDLGFLPDVERIVTQTPENRQTMLFSATMPGVIVNLARRYMRQPTHIRAASHDDESATVDTVEQHVYRAHEMDKPELLARILQADGRGLTIVFCRTRRACDRVAADLGERGFAAAAVHGDLGQGAREQALRAFRAGKVDVLVATDVAARGIDIDGVSHVINYTCPEDEKTYLHRVGRTARAGNDGVAVTLVDWADVTRWAVINKALGLAFFDPPETYSTSEWIYTALNIPKSARGLLPRAQRTRAGLSAEEVEDLGETGKARKGGFGPGRFARDSDGRGSRPSSSGERGDRRPHSDQAASDEPAVERGPRAPRGRRRTRSGEPLGADVAVSASPAAGRAGSVQNGAGGSAGLADRPDAERPSGDGASAPRRRRRGGRGRGGSAAAEAAGSST
jgi:superfamily II DNA/RNA helicase